MVKTKVIMAKLLLMSLSKELTNLEKKLDVLGNTRATIGQELKQLASRKGVVSEEAT